MSACCKMFLGADRLFWPRGLGTIVLMPRVQPVGGTCVLNPGHRAIASHRRIAALLTIMVPVAVTAFAPGAGATDIGPGLVTGPIEVTSSDSPANVVGFTSITSTGNGIDAPSNAGPGVMLNINTGSAPGGVISITSDGLGVNSNFPSSAATINIASGPSGPVRILSGGAALAIAGDSSLIANANGGNLVFHSTAGAFGVVAQFGAAIDVIGPATIISDAGLAAVLIGGGATDIGSQATLTNVNILANGALIGLDVTRMSTVVTMTGGSIAVIGDGLAGLYSDTDGVTNATNVNISTTGADTYGAFAEATVPAPGFGVTPGGGTINITGGSITTGGTGAFGVFAQGQPSIPSTITLNNSAITTTGDGAAGYRADGGTISSTKTTTQTSGAAAPGGMLSNGGMLSINGGSVTTTGAGSFGFLVQPFTPVLGLNADPTLPRVPLTPQATLPNVLQISNATVTSAADAFHVNGAIANIAVNGSTITSGNGVLLNNLSSGTTTLTASNSQLTGAITTDSTSTANVTLHNTTTWTMTGSSNLSSLVNDTSTIFFAPPSGDPTQLASYKTLSTINYTGVGGRIVLNTFLGTDGSPSDRLIINGGSATGTSAIQIIHAGGAGVETVANGIPVVQAINGGSTATGAFQLGNLVEAGPFEYRLFRGSVDASAPNDWFLRSDFIVPPTGPTTPPITPPTGPTTPPVTPPTGPTTPPVTPPTPPITALPPDPLPDPLPPGSIDPIIGPRLATYGVVQPIARQMGLTTLGTMHERIGDTLTVGNAGSDAEGWLRSTWGRVIGQQIDNHYQAFADPRASGRLIGLQFGVDVWRGSFEPGSRDVAGLYFGYLNGDTNVDGLVTNADATAYVLQRTGTLNLNSYSLGGYWTHYGPGGWYLDGVLQGTRYGGDATTQFSAVGLTTTLPTQGSGFVSSLEGGYPIPLAFGPGFVLEPQAQIIWQEVDFDGASDGISTVALGSTSGTTGRLGVRGQWTIPGANGEVWQPYGRFNIWRDWGGNAATSFAGSGIAVPLVEQATRLELAGGLTFKLQANLSFYTQIGYQFAVAPTNAGRDGVKGDIGLRYTW